MILKALAISEHGDRGLQHFVGPANLHGHQWGCSGPGADHTAGDSTKKKKNKKNKKKYRTG